MDIDLVNDLRRDEDESDQSDDDDVKKPKKRNKKNQKDDENDEEDRDEKEDDVKKVMKKANEVAKKKVAKKPRPKLDVDRYFNLFKSVLINPRFYL